MISFSNCYLILGEIVKEGNQSITDITSQESHCDNGASNAVSKSQLINGDLFSKQLEEID